MKKILIALLLAFFVSGCAHYIVREAKTTAIDSSSSIGVIVKGKNTKATMASFMTSALINKGLNAKVIDPEELLPSKVKDSISPDYKYSFLEALVMSMYSGKADVKGSKELIAQLYGVNDMKESSTRLSDLVDLIDKFMKTWNIRYLLSIEEIAPFSFNVRITDLTSKTLVFVYYIEANEKGFNEIVSAVEDSDTFTASSSARRSSRYTEVQLCEHIVSRIKE